jgi:hypothetical protein
MVGLRPTGSTSGVADPHPARRVVTWLLIATLLAVAGLSVHTATAHAGARSIQVKFTNSSDSSLTLTKAQLDHGCWAQCGSPPGCPQEGTPKQPPSTIPIGAFVEFESESCGVATGTEFHVAYKLANGTQMEMHYDVPFCSNVICEVNPECDDSAPEGYEMTHEGCNSSHVVLTTKFRCDSTGCDGIPDEWKKNGVVINPATGKPNPAECEGLLFCPNFINLPAMGVSLDRPNVLIQMDWMQETEGKKRNQQLEQTAINKVIEAFNKDPVTYPGATRSGITLIVDNGPESTISPGGKKWGALSRAKAIPWEEFFLTGSRSGFNTENFQKLLENNFTPTGRAPIFHYVAAVANLSAEGECTSGLTPNAGTKKGFGFIVSLGGIREPAKEGKPAVPCWENEEKGTETQQTGTFMHELGHTLGLSHGGEDGVNFKPNYPSVMNYLFQFPGVLRNEERVYDYSREPEPSLEEKTLTEKAGINLGANPLKYGISWICPIPKEPTESTSALAEVDWNCDKKIDGGEGFIVNGTGGREAEGKEKEPEIQRELKGTAASDWARIDFHTGGVGTGAAAANEVTVDPVVPGHEITPAIAAQVRTTPHLSYTGALTGHYHDPVTASAKLVDPTTKNSPVVGASIAFSLGSSASDTCTAKTDSSGSASCIITPTQEAGEYKVVASFAGDSAYQPANDAKTFTISPEETTMSYTGPTVILAGASGATLTATLVEDGSADNDSDGGSPAPVPSETVTLAIGTQTCSGETNAEGKVSCTIPSVTTPLGPETVGAVFSGDGFYSESSASKTAIVFAFPSRGVFTLGDKTVASASETTTVTWWADTWSILDSLSGGLTPPAFKGFAGVITLPTTTPVTKCGSSWTTTGGNSPPPTSGVPTYMGTVVTSKVTKPNTTITGDTVKIVVVKTNRGYAPDPGQHGTGTIVATFC